jgi:hypothetical protein
MARPPNIAATPYEHPMLVATSLREHSIKMQLGVHQSSEPTFAGVY